MLCSANITGIKLLLPYYKKKELEEIFKKTRVVYKKK